MYSTVVPGVHVHYKTLPQGGGAVRSEAWPLFTPLGSTGTWYMCIGTTCTCYRSKRRAQYNNYLYENLGWPKATTQNKKKGCKAKVRQITGTGTRAACKNETCKRVYNTLYGITE